MEEPQPLSSDRISWREAEFRSDGEPVCGDESRLASTDDRLLRYLLESTTRSDIVEALSTKGYCMIPSVFSAEECSEAIDLIWDFIEETTSGTVQKHDPTTWYPINESAIDPWPCTPYKSFSEMFQTRGAGWLLGEIREKMADRVFEPLFKTNKLICSKEGFTFHRPWREITRRSNSWHVCGKPQVTSVGEHYDQALYDRGLHTIQACISLEDQYDGDGCFYCYPGSFGDVHQALLTNTYRGRFPWVPLTDQDICRLKEEFHVQGFRVPVRKGDVILFRSDLVHTALSPSAPTGRFRAVAYCSMLPLSLLPPTTDNLWQRKIDAYTQRQTSDHRPYVESWHEERSNGYRHHRPYFRTHPPIISIRQAQLYGLLRYELDDDLEKELNRAMLRGVRFREKGPYDFSLRSASRECGARLQFLQIKEEVPGQEKYLGGMESACGRYIYGVPGGARRVLRIHVIDGKMDLIGPEFPGRFKWLRGVTIPPTSLEEKFRKRYPAGCCLALPCNAPSILKINPETDEVYTFGEDVILSRGGSSGWYYHGGCYQNGWLYAIPANANQVLKFHPATDETLLIGPIFEECKQKWYGGIVGSDGCIYGIPHNHSGVLKINPWTDDVAIIYPLIPFPVGQWKWHGGLRAGEKIIGFPNNAGSVLVIDCNPTGKGVYTIDGAGILTSGRHRSDDRYKYLGGALTTDGRYAYLFPCDAERVLRVDCHLDEACLVGPLLLDGQNKFQNGFVSEKDSCLYGIPQRATGILRITHAVNPTEVHVDIMDCSPELQAVRDKFEGGVMGLDGNIYCIPLRSKICVKIIPECK